MNIDEINSALTKLGAAGVLANQVTLFLAGCESTAEETIKSNSDRLKQGVLDAAPGDITQLDLKNMLLDIQSEMEIAVVELGTEAKVQAQKMLGIVIGLLKTIFPVLRAIG